MKNTIIVDLDGTLYYQYGVHLVMGCQLLLHFWKVKDLKIIMEYRKIREKNINNIVDKQYKIVADKYHVEEEYVKKVIDEWLFQRPLKALKKFKDKQLDKIITEFSQKGGKVYIYSDYPTKEKLKQLNTKFDKAYDSTNDNIKTLKPDKKGLEYIIKENNLQKEKILFIGDRDSKDGEISRKCNIDYVILPKLFRKKKISQIKQMIGLI